MLHGDKQIKIAWAPIYAHPLPEGHRFPMLKYELIPGQLLHEGTITQQNIFAPTICSDDIVLLTHDVAYLRKLHTLTLTEKDQRHIGFPQSKQLIERELIIAQGTIDCCLYALQNGVALNVAGGTHHAFTNRGEGFCLLNDMAIAANYLLNKNIVEKIAIVDLDVHQGNGTAKIFENNNNVYTFSMHGGHNYPFIKETSDWDIPLADGTNDETYLKLLADALQKILSEVKPQFVFYLSGVDVLATDKYGKLKLTLQGCAQRDRMVFDALKQNGVPCTVAMGGGYSTDVKIITEAHCNTFRIAKEVFDL
jgi:acetoin utilization deacetylase AcuC-like enzyme